MIFHCFSNWIRIIVGTRIFFNFKEDEHIFLMSYFSQIEIGITQIIVSLQRNKEIMRYDVLFFPAPAKHNNLSSTVFRFVFLLLYVWVWVLMGEGCKLKDVSYRFSLNRCYVLFSCISIVQDSLLHEVTVF